jgi:hypothetical protein
MILPAAGSHQAREFAPGTAREVDQSHQLFVERVDARVAVDLRHHRVVVRPVPVRAEFEIDRLVGSGRREIGERGEPIPLRLVTECEGRVVERAVFAQDRRGARAGRGRDRRIGTRSPPFVPVIDRRLSTLMKAAT